MNQHNEGQADRALARRVLAGAPGAIDELIERMRCVPRILAARNARAGRPLGPEELADLAQEVFAIVWRKLADYRGEAPFEGWVHTFCVLQFMNMARKHTGRPANVETSEIANEQTVAAPASSLPSLEAARLHTALAELDDVERTVIELKHFDELTFERIAERLEFSTSTAKSRYYRGLTKLQATLGPHFLMEESS